MPSRSSKRGKVTSLANAILDVSVSHKSSPMMAIITEKEGKRSRRNRKGNSVKDSFNKENQFNDPSLVQKKVLFIAKHEKQPHVESASAEEPRRFTRSLKVHPEDEVSRDAAPIEIGGKRKKKLIQIEEGSTELPSAPLPTRKLTRRNKEADPACETIIGVASASDSETSTSHKASKLPVIVDHEETKTRNVKKQNQKTQMVDLNMPSKRGSTESSNVINANNPRTRSKIIYNHISEREVSSDENTKPDKKSTKTSRKQKNSPPIVKINQCVVSDENLSVASDETSYHSAKSSLGLLGNIDKEDCSFSSVVESLIDLNTKNSSLTNKSNTINNKKNANREHQNTLNQKVSDQLNETYPILPLDSSNSESEMPNPPAKIILKSLQSKKLIRISGIEEFEQPIVPVPVMQRQGTFVKENSFNISNTGIINISDNSQNLSMDRSSKRKFLSASSPCKVFCSKSTINLDSLAAIKTPLKPICQAVSVGSAGQTPMPPRKLSSTGDSKPSGDSTPLKSSKSLNRTHSIEKPSAQNSAFNGKSDQTSVSKSRGRVAFCNSNRRQVSFAAHSGKIIKSSMKGSNNSFLLTNTLKQGSRKRSITQDSDSREDKIRKMTAKDLNLSVSRLSKPKTPISEVKSRYSSKVNNSTCGSTPAKLQLAKLAAPLSRSKMPDFASLHKKQFEQMESLVQNKVRKEERAKQLLFPSISVNSPKANKQELKGIFKDLPMIRNQTYTRFGYKVQQNGAEPIGNVSTVGSVSETKKTALPASAAKTRMTKSQVRSIVMREEGVSLVEKKRNENRAYVKGIRTNRRFELQMKSRNLAA